MMHPKPLPETLDREYLTIRGKILELAAALDRLDRSPTPHTHNHAIGQTGRSPDRRLAQIRNGLEALMEPGPGRAEAVQQIFSREYDPDWRVNFGMPTPRF